jgi:leukotriene A-4 hydrolase/aminopeptidase
MRIRCSRSFTFIVGFSSLVAITGRAMSSPERDAHSFSNPQEVRVRHVDLSWDVDFKNRILDGEAILHIERRGTDPARPLILDSRNLHIHSIDDCSHRSLKWSVAPADRVLGSAIRIELPGDVDVIRVRYATDPQAAGLQWLTPLQTAGKKQPFLFTQSEAIQVRSWIPLQDSPAVRVTYSARVRPPAGTMAVMSAAGNPTAVHAGEYRFEMKDPIPPYLIALAVGDLAFRPVGPRTGVYAEPIVVDQAARELEDLETMVKKTESVYGAYRWGRYDILILPPSFPMGGMENPRLTFATPTILAGDKSLVSLVCHELAHSWSGNLVTNATWRDFWLNEGFAVYLERRILEAVYGKSRADMEAVLGKQDLDKEIADLPGRDQVLHVDLTGRDPDEGFSDVPYEKGALFLRALEQAYGRQAFDQFLKSYFDHFAFQSITTADFRSYLQKNLIARDADKTVSLDEWLEKPGIPAEAPKLRSEPLEQVDKLGQRWAKGQMATSALPAGSWCTQEWLQFLRALPAKLTPEQMAELDAAFHLSQSGNSEIKFQWLMMAITNHYEPAFPRLTEFLTTVGRRKFLKPLYEELVKTKDGKERALAIYARARPAYHPMAAATIDAVLAKDSKQSNHDSTK